MTRYANSEDWLARAEQTIPLGSQTFSKSRTQYPVGISPLYIKKAKGSYVWDLDNHKYFDLVSSLASVTLGYNHRQINRAVRRQLKQGVSFSLPGTLEAEVAELICGLVPSAEMVRFGKNGTDATSAAVRLARAYTGRDHIAVCGYHGWQDWYIGSTSRNKGVPNSVSELTSVFQYNDIASLEKIIASQPQLACVIMEPMNAHYPKANFLEDIRTITQKNGIILIFDETITGFRFSKGGAQELFGVTPDLSTFGKGIANGFPLSAVVGKREIMQEMENIFFSGTFGGELLSLAAAKSVLMMHEKNQITQTLHDIGFEISSKLEKVISATKLENTLQISGHPSWKFLNWKQSYETEVGVIRTYFLQEMFASGILVLNTHNVNLAMTDNDINNLVEKYTVALSQLKTLLESGKLSAELNVEPLEPLFKVR
jgi:glutamate-1-semialdehyde 2,1-aminomutase